MNNLKQIILFTKMYAVEHDDKYPLSLNDLVGTNYVRSGDFITFVCQANRASHASSNLTFFLSTNIHSWTDYAYVSGLKDSDPANLTTNHHRDNIHQLSKN